jgi:hypothetical protein
MSTRLRLDGDEPQVNWFIVSFGTYERCCGVSFSGDCFLSDVPCIRLPDCFAFTHSFPGRTGLLFFEPVLLEVPLTRAAVKLAVLLQTLRLPMFSVSFVVSAWRRLLLELLLLVVWD